jgi:hypothetical protein
LVWQLGFDVAVRFVLPVAEPGATARRLICVVLANASFASDAVNDRLPDSWAKSHNLFFIPVKIWTFFFLAVWVYALVSLLTH